MKTNLGQKQELSLEQRLAVVTHIENLFKEAGLFTALHRVDWQTDLDFPVVEPAGLVEQLPPAIRMRYLKLINRIIEVSV